MLNFILQAGNKIKTNQSEVVFFLSLCDNMMQPFKCAIFFPKHVGNLIQRSSHTSGKFLRHINKKTN